MECAGKKGLFWNYNIDRVTETTDIKTGGLNVINEM